MKSFPSVGRDDAPSDNALSNNRNEQRNLILNITRDNIIHHIDFRSLDQ